MDKSQEKVEYHRQLHGDSLIDRDLVVLLPNDYASNNEKHYPVLYMHDGQKYFLIRQPVLLV